MFKILNYLIWFLCPILLYVPAVHAQEDAHQKTLDSNACAQKILACEKSPKAVNALQNIFLCNQNFETSPGNNKVYRQCVLDSYKPSTDKISSILRFDNSHYIEGEINWKPYIQIMAKCAKGCFDEEAYDELKQCYEKIHSTSKIIEISCW